MKIDFHILSNHPVITSRFIAQIIKFYFYKIVKDIILIHKTILKVNQYADDSVLFFNVFLVPLYGV